MAAAPMRSTALRIAPFVTTATLATWCGIDVLSVSDPPLFRGLAALLLYGTVALGLANVPGWGWTQTSGLVSIGVGYLGAHVIALGIDLVAALAFLTLLIVHIEVRVAAGRFAPLYARPLLADQRHAVDATLRRAALRIGFASALALLVPILAANIAAAGIVPVRTIPTAMLLGGAIVVVFALLALLPVLNYRPIRR